MLFGFIVLIVFKLIANSKAKLWQENITLIVGDTLKIECPTSVSFRVPVIWNVNGSVVKNARIVDRYLIIKNVTEENEGVYSCKPTKRSATKNATFDVKVMRSNDYKGTINNTNGFGPVFIKQHLMILGYISRFSGQSVRLNCPFVGDPKPKIVWLRDMKPIQRLNGHSLEYLKGYILHMENLLESDSGEYTCMISNIYGSINHTYILSVTTTYNHHPLFRRGNEETVYANIYSDVELDCTFDDDFDTRWFWARVWRINETDVQLNKSISEDGRWYYDVISSIDEDNTSLFILNLTENNFGYYTCVAENHYGTSIRLINLTRLVAPEQVIVYAQKDENPNTEGINSFLKYGIVCITIILVALSCCFVKCCVKSKETIVKAERTYVIRKNVIRISDINGAMKPFIPRFKIEEIEKSAMPLKYGQIVVRYNIPTDIQWEVPRDGVELNEKIGEGAFGLVFKAKLRISNSESVKDVAVKTLKLEHRDEDVISLLQEIEIMKKVGKHENVISLLGCCLKKGPVLLIMECAENGNLKNFLMKLANYPNQLKVEDFVNFAVQIASGMQHLASKGCVHRDLAARNVLVAESNIMKISDFGLTRNLNTRGYYKAQNTDQLLPVRWMAPEAWNEDQFSTKSDVWSFGVLLWEIFTHAAQPYESVDDIKTLWSRIANGLRLSKPDSCPESVYKLMSRCWNDDASLRPDFLEIVYYLRKRLY